MKGIVIIAALMLLGAGCSPQKRGAYPGTEPYVAPTAPPPAAAPAPSPPSYNYRY